MSRYTTSPTWLPTKWPDDQPAQRALAEQLYADVDERCRHGGGPDLHRLIQQLPVTTRTSCPLLAFVEAMCLLNAGQGEAASEMLEPLWRSLCQQQHADVPASFPVDVAVLTAYCHVLLGRAEAAQATVDDCRQRFAVTPDQDARLAIVTALAQFPQQCDTAIDLCRSASARAGASPHVRASAFAYLAAMLAEVGRRREAETSLRKAKAILARFPEPSLHCLTKAIQAKCELACGNPVAALHCTEQALPAAAKAGSVPLRTLLYWLHVKSLARLGRWSEVADWLARLDNMPLAGANEIRLEAVRVLSYVHQGQNDLALQLLEQLLQQAPANAAQVCTAMLDLAEAAEIAGSPRVAALLSELRQQVPSAFVLAHARLAWLSARHAFRLGQDYRPHLAEFIRLCEQHRLPGLLGQAARQLPAIFVDGIANGVTSSLLPAVLPRLSDEHLERLADVTACEAACLEQRETAFHVLARQPESPATLRAAQALAVGAQTDLQQAAARLLELKPAYIATRPPGRLELRTLGEFALTHDGRPLGTHLRRKAQAILVMLLLASPDPLSRDAIQEALWPDLEPRAAANNLRVVVHNLRRVLASAASKSPSDTTASLVLKTGPDWSLQLLGVDTVSWDAQELTDYITVARRCAAAGQITEAIAAYTHAVSLYRGPFMAQAPGDTTFAMERNHYARMVQEAKLDLASLHLDHGDPAEALAIAESAAEAEPLDEIAHQLIMRAHVALGYPHRAAAAYERYKQVVTAEAGTSPRVATQRLLERLLSQAG